jgi:hypothetical protein
MYSHVADNLINPHLPSSLSHLETAVISTNNNFQVIKSCKHEASSKPDGSQQKNLYKNSK